MHQTRKGNEWHFGMKAHIGVDIRLKVIYSVAATAANVHDSAFQGQGEMIHVLAPQARDMTHRRYRRAGHADGIERPKKRHKSRVRTKVEHPFLLLKAIFGFRKVRYRGLSKNAQRLNVAFALVNLHMLRRALLRLA